jgi:hypothetical protein
LLIPFISWAIDKENPLVRLRLEDCDLSTIGVSKLLECLTSAKKTLDMLSVADNPLGKSVISFFFFFLLFDLFIFVEMHFSSVAGALAKFLGSRVREINVEDIGLGALGFQTLEEALPMDVSLSYINIR